MVSGMRKTYIQMELSILRIAESGARRSQTKLMNVLFIVINAKRDTA